jgi:hypothetical protein
LLQSLRISAAAIMEDHERKLAAAESLIVPLPMAVNQ